MPSRPIPAAPAASSRRASRRRRGWLTTPPKTPRTAPRNVRRYSMIVPGPTFSGYVAVQVPENASRIYTDDAIRQMFASAVVRNEVPVDEQLGLMPFRMAELSNFKTVRTLAPGAALILADGDEKSGFETAPFMIIGIVGSTPAQPDDRGRFCPADGHHDSRRARRAHHDVRTGPHRRPARIRDAHRCRQRQGQYAGDDRAMVAVRRPEFAAHHRQFAARRLDQARSRVSAPCATEFARANAARGAEDFVARRRVKPLYAVAAT